MKLSNRIGALPLSYCSELLARSISWYKILGLWPNIYCLMLRGKAPKLVLFDALILLSISIVKGLCPLTSTVIEGPLALLLCLCFAQESNSRVTVMGRRPITYSYIMGLRPHYICFAASISSINNRSFAPIIIAYAYGYWCLGHQYPCFSFAIIILGY